MRKMGLSAIFFILTFLSMGKAHPFTPCNQDAQGPKRIHHRLEWQEGPMPKGAYKATCQDFSQENLLYQKACSLLKEKKIEEAHTLFCRFSPTSPYYPQSLYWQGMIAMLYHHQPQKAAALFGKAYQLAEKEDRLFALSILTKLAEAFMRANKRQEARTILGHCQEKAVPLQIPSHLRNSIDQLVGQLKQAPDQPCP